MAQPRRFLFVLPVAGLLAGFAWLVLRPHETVVQGKPLSRWLFDAYRGAAPGGDGSIANAEGAVRALGTNLLPVLVKMAGTRVTGFRMTIGYMAREESLAFLHLPPQHDKHETAVWAFKVLGPAARPAVPALIKLVSDRDAGVRLTAVECLASLGPAASEAVPVLVGSLSATNRGRRDDPGLRSAAAYALGEIGPAAHAALARLASTTNDLNAQVALLKIKGESFQPLIERLEDASDPGKWIRTVHLVANLGTNAEPAIPFILAALRQPTNNAIRADAIAALGRIHRRPEVCVPAIIPYLDPTNRNLCRPSILALRAFGAAAQPAVPALIHCLRDSDRWVRTEATNALRQIAPEAAALAGVKSHDVSTHR